jgi:hypothetical protein
LNKHNLLFHLFDFPTFYLLSLTSFVCMEFFHFFNWIIDQLDWKFIRWKFSSSFFLADDGIHGVFHMFETFMSCLLDYYGIYCTSTWLVEIVVLYLQLSSLVSENKILVAKLKQAYKDSSQVNANLSSDHEVGTSDFMNMFIICICNWYTRISYVVSIIV